MDKGDSGLDWRWGSVLTLTLAWSVFVIYQAAGPLDDYVVLFRELWMGVSDLPSASGFARAIFNHLLVLFSAVVFVLVAVRGGDAVKRIFKFEGLSGLERTCVSAILGWTALGVTFLGFALSGIFYPWLLFATCGLFLFLGTWSQKGGKSGLFRIEGFRRPPEGTLGLFLLIAAPFLLFFPLLVLVPPLHIDFCGYHMAAPERFLQMHRFDVQGTDVRFMTFLTTEMMYALARSLGQDALAPLISMVPFLAGLLAAGAWVARTHDARTAAIGIAVACSAGWVTIISASGKNDLAAAGICLAAFIAQAQGRRLMPGLLWGIACGVKINCIPFAGLAWIWHEAGRLRKGLSAWRPDAVWLWALTLPVLPWLTKSWLFRGDPLWPALSGHISTALWRDSAEKARRIVMAQEQSFASRAVTGLKSIVENYPAIVSGIFLILYLRKFIDRRLGGIAVLSAVMLVVFVLGIWAEPRFTIPLGLVWAFVLSSVLGSLMRDFGKFGRGALAALLCVFSCVSVGRALSGQWRERDADSVRYVSGRLGLEGFLSAKQATRRQAQKALAEISDPGSVMLIDNYGACRWSGKTLTEGFFDQSPTWMLTREAGDVKRLLVRLRQENVRYIVLNFVADIHISGQGAAYAAYDWDKRQIGILRDFIKYHTEIAVHPVRISTGIGGFYIYRIVYEGRSSPGPVYYLPGTKALLWRLYLPYSTLVDARSARANFDAYSALYPDVGVFRMMSGLLSFLQEDWRRAHEDYSSIIESGMSGDCIHIICAEAAAKLGRDEEALGYFSMAQGLYEGQSDWIGRGKSLVLRRLALRYLSDASKKHKSLDLAREAVDLEPDNPMAHASLGIVLYELSHHEEARKVLEAARNRWPANRKVEAVFFEYIRKIDREAAEAK